MEPRRDAVLERLAEGRAALRDGRTVVTRAGRTADSDALALMHGRCSTATVYGRYLAAAPRDSRSWQRRLLSTQVVLTAWDRRRLVALGNVARQPLTGTPEPGVAPDIGPPLPEGAATIALIVEDDYQGAGLGSQLAQRLVGAARHLGLRWLVARTLAGAEAAHRILDGIGPVEVRELEDGTRLSALRLSSESAYLFRPVTQTL